MHNLKQLIHFNEFIEVVYVFVRNNWTNGRPGTTRGIGTHWKPWKYRSVSLRETRTIQNELKHFRFAEIIFTLKFHDQDF